MSKKSESEKQQKDPAKFGLYPQSAVQLASGNGDPAAAKGSQWLQQMLQAGESTCFPVPVLGTGLAPSDCAVAAKVFGEWFI